MDAFDDENPFDTESDRISSEASSASKVDISEPPSPPFNPSRQLSSEIINSDRTFLHGSHRQQSHSHSNNNKIDFCCARDRVLHSGDDIEILVRVILLGCYSFANVLPADYRRSKDQCWSDFTIYNICYSDWSELLIILP